jgi:NAD(P)H-flavin reductase
MSIASAPERLPHGLVLHFRALPGVSDAALMEEILARVTHGSRDVEIEGPFGNVCVDGPNEQDLLLLAGGSGIAQVLAIASHLRHTGQTREVRLVWSAARADHFYADEELRSYAPWLRYTPVVDAPNSDNAAVVWLRRQPELRYDRVIISGGPGFVYAVADALNELGVPADAVESDVFSYAPRR